MDDKFGVHNPSAAFDELFGDMRQLPLPTGVDRVQAYERLNRFGVARVLEMISKGRLGPEIAADVGVPMVHFQSWVEETIDPADLDKARRAAAEAFVVKSILPLTVTYDQPGHATIAKALSERMAWVAQRLDPNRWGDVKPAHKDGAPVKFVFNFGDKNVSVEAKPVEAEVARPIEENLKVLALPESEYVVVDDE